jgi:beta-glucanase (GH16 family)
VGPKNSLFPEFYEAQPFEKENTAMYDDRHILKADLGFTHETNSFIYGKGVPLRSDLGPIPDEPNELDEYENYPLETYSETWSYSESNGKPRIHLSDDGFFGFYVGGDHVYEIVRQTETSMTLKTVGFDDNAWFVILSSEGDGEIPDDPEFKTLVFEDNFNVNGSPDENKWGYDIGRGENGWGNGEEQFYTNRPANAVIEDGNLKIIAKKENYQGAAYTSARLKTQDKFDFTYGRVEVRAKLPKGGGTWPALWMLGSNFPEVSWPACGEIDIMEYVGNEPGSIQSALHNPSSFGDTKYKKSTEITDESDSFHVYSMIWSEEQISFYLDGERFYIYRPESRNSNNWPYNKPQFLIMNVAMGGTLGGDIDPAFSESAMEIDYVRIYQ